MNGDTDLPDDVFDVMIVGGGTAGCVLAGRLSEDPACKVLLIEAGPDMIPGSEPDAIRSVFPLAHVERRFLWRDIQAATVDGGPRRFLAQGFGVGGSSNVQGMFAVRGIPEDYDEWTAAGVRGWAWKDVLPYFRKLERDLDCHDALHGNVGPIPIRRTPPEQWGPFSRAIGDALVRRGFPLLDDYNGAFGDGVAALPMANLPEGRVSTAMAYLDNMVRRRANLHILANVRISHLLLEQRRATGVAAEIGGNWQVLRGREIILAAGAIQSPCVLMRSGIGCAGQLGAMGIDVVHDLPGVGRNLQNHPKIQDIAVHLSGHARQDTRSPALGQNCLRFSSGLAGCPAQDMFLVSLNRTGWHSLGAQIGAVGVVVHKPFSTGSVSLSAPDSHTLPRIDFNALSDPRDGARLEHGLALALDLLRDPAVAALSGEPFVPGPKLATRYARRTRLAAMETGLLGPFLAAAPIRRAILSRSRIDLTALADDPIARTAFVRARVEVSRHISGTAKMGPADDRMAVTDDEGRVHGIAGLRVADASIFPTLMRANTHIPVIMAAEKVADSIKRERH